MINKVKKIFKEYMNVKDCEIINIKQMIGGMSNFVFKVETTTGLYTLRLPGDSADKFVNRKIERYHLDLVSDLNINSITLYNNPKTGIKISTYISGKPTNQPNYQNLSALLKKVHSKSSVYDYEPFKRLNLYESYSTNQLDEYFKLKQKLLNYKNYLKNVELVFCHGDFIKENILLNTQLHLLDWEFAGNNDPIYDIACFGENDPALGLELLEAYYQTVTEEHKKRLVLWTIFQCLQWYNVAIFKHNIGLSEKLDVDFLKLSNYFITKAHSLFEDNINIL